MVDSRLKKDTRAEKKALAKTMGKRKTKRMQRKRKSRNWFFILKTIFKNNIKKQQLKQYKQYK